MTNRDLGAELLLAVREIKRGGGRRYVVEVPRDVPMIRPAHLPSQSAFGALLGVSVRTLQDWEKGRRHPTGPASRSCALPIGTRGRWSIDRSRRTRAEAGVARWDSIEASP